MKLTEVEDKTIVLVKKVVGSEEVKRRVYELKIYPGIQVVAVKNNKGSYIIIETDNGKFGIPFDLAENIIVEVIGVTSVEK